MNEGEPASGPRGEPAGGPEPNPSQTPSRSAPTDATIAGPAAPTDATIGSGMPPAATVAAPPTPLPLLDQARIGRYRVQERIGRGGMGFVFKAWHEGLERAFALKIIQPTLQTPASLVERFLREARAVARIGKHPHIVQVHDAGQEGSLYYIAMDLVEGDPLDRRLRAGPMDPQEAARIARGIALGLQVAHEAGIVHRDLKPSNVLLAPDGTPLVTDFGIARDANEVRNVSQDGEVLGTISYMSPEQASGNRALLGPATDVYGLGATLYEMLAGRPPFGGANPFEVWTAVVGQEPERPGHVNPAVPADLETICLKAMEKDPSRRYASAREMSEDLDRFLAGDPILSRPASAVSRLLWKAVRRRRVLLPAAISALLVAGAVGLLLHSQAERGREVAGLSDAGRLARAEGRIDDARDAFQRLRALVPDSADAREGFAWADGEVKRRDAAIEARRALAREEQTAAEGALRKAGLAQAVLARWVMLLPTLAELERDYYDASLAPDERRRRGEERWAGVDAFMRETPDDPTSQSTMYALAGWARRLAGRETEGVDWMARARTLDPDLPYGDLMEALVFLSRYLSWQELPGLSLGPFGLIIGEAPPERPQLRELRVKMEALLQSASRAPIWGEGMAGEFRGAIAAVQQMQSGKYAESEAAYTALLGTAALGGFRSDILLARGKVRYLLKKFEEAIGDLERVIEARPGSPEAYYFRGLIRAAKADEMQVAGKDARAIYPAAIKDFDEAMRLMPGYYYGNLARGTAYLALARATEARGEDPAPCYESAVRDFGDAIALSPRDPVARLNRSIALSAQAQILESAGKAPWEPYESARKDLEAAIENDPMFVDAHRAMGSTCISLGHALSRAGRDPLETLQGAIDAFSDVITARPEEAEAYLGRGVARASIADWLVPHGQDPREFWETAYEDFTTTIEKEPRLYHGYANRAMLLEQLGRFDEALADYEAGLKVAPGEPMLSQGLLRARSMKEASSRPAPAWAKLIKKGSDHLKAQEYVEARAKYEEALAAITPEEAKQPLYFEFMMELNYNLACIYALLSTGRESPEATVREVGEEEAASWRDKAFARLRASSDLGWRDPGMLRGDPDLAPLHDDPRWQEALTPRPR